MSAETMGERHLDDEQLSALLDGDDVDRAHLASAPDDATAGAHLASCPRCSSRLDALRSARDAVAAATVPPLSAATLDRLVGAALDAAPPPAASDPAVVPISRGRRRVPPPAWLVGVAAALLALVGIAGVLRSVDRDGGSLALTSGRDDADSSAGAEKSAEVGAGAAVSGSGSTSAAADTAAATAIDPEAVSFDLADQQDPAELGVLLHDGVPTSDAARAASGQTFSSGSATTAPPTAAAPAPQAPAADRAQCRIQAEAHGGDAIGPLVATGTVRWKGQPAEVLVFELRRPAEGVTRQAMVLRRPGCSLLAEQRF